MLLQTVLFSAEVNCIVFSYDRPLQLYAFLESLYQHGRHLHQTVVIYRTSHQEYADGYKIVSDAFPQVRFIQQTSGPSDFKPLLIQEICNSESEYIAFAVDDIIVTDEIDFKQCVDALERTAGHGFFLRLGRNIDDCLSSNQFGAIPPLIEVGHQIYKWQFKDGVGDWAYPNTLDMTIYKTKKIEGHLKEALFSNPNTLEDQFGEINLELYGLCFESSKVVNIPLNIVSHTSATAHLNISAMQLLEQFNAGFKIDIIPFFKCKNRSSHFFNLAPTFIPRNQ